MREATPLRRLVVPVFLPSAVFGLGQGAAAPIVALHARELGASIGVAGLIVAALGLGHVLGDLPAGQIVARIGERKAVLLGSAVGVIGVVLCLLSWTPVVLAVGVGLFGMAEAMWALARQAYVADAVPLALRARAYSTLAGLMRLGALIGPFVGAGAVAVMGVRGGFVVQLAGVLIAGVLMATLPDVDDDTRSARPAASLGAVLIAHRRVLGTLGASALLLGAARASRTAVLPLWAEQIGLDAVTTSLLFGVGALVDVALSYPAGRWMDRRGRRPVAVASLVTFTAAHVALPLAVGLVPLAGVVVLMGAANGLSNGLIMTIGADAAPTEGRAEFLGGFRLCHDIGMLAGPLVIGAVSAAAPLAVAALVLGGLSGLGAAGMARWVPRGTVSSSGPVTPDAPGRTGSARCRNR